MLRVRGEYGNVVEGASSAKTEVAPPYLIGAKLSAATLGQEQ